MKKYFLFIAIILFTISGLKAQTYKVIVNNSNPVTTLSKAEISNFLLKKKGKWSSGTEVSPVDLSSKSTVREQFSKDIHGKTTAQIRAFWQQSVFSGKSSPPAEMESDSKVVEFVKNNMGAIGYVSAGASTAGVKVVNLN